MTSKSITLTVKLMVYTPRAI